MDEEIKMKLIGLDTRVTALEGQMNSFNDELRLNRAELRSNTRLTEDIHGQHNEIYETYLYAKNGVKVLGKIGNGIMWVADRSGRLAKPLIAVFLITGTTWTGAHVPEWIRHLVDFLK